MKMTSGSGEHHATQRALKLPAMGVLTGALWEAPERVIRPGRRGAMGRW